jgi:hypothetical protein
MMNHSQDADQGVHSEQEGAYQELDVDGALHSDLPVVLVENNTKMNWRNLFSHMLRIYCHNQLTLEAGHDQANDGGESTHSTSARMFISLAAAIIACCWTHNGW